MQGYQKIIGCCKQAASDGLDAVVQDNFTPIALNFLIRRT
jgi:hypothetical protein